MADVQSVGITELFGMDRYKRRPMMEPFDTLLVSFHVGPTNFFDSICTQIRCQRFFTPRISCFSRPFKRTTVLQSEESEPRNQLFESLIPQRPSGLRGNPGIPASWDKNGFFPIGSRAKPGNAAEGRCKSKFISQPPPAAGDESLPRCLARGIFLCELRPRSACLFFFLASRSSFQRVLHQWKERKTKERIWKRFC